MLIKFATFRLPLLSLALFFAISGCIPQAQSEKEKPSTVSKDSQQWTVLLSISGGIAGWMKNTSIDSAGILIINDLRRNKSIRNKVNNNELAALSDLLVEIKDLKTDPEPSRIPNICADCFNYELSIRSHNRQLLVTLNDINLSKSGFNNIVVFLRKISMKYEK